MEQLQSAFEPYRHLDPIGWVGVFRFMPWWGGVVALALGVVMLMYGGRRLFRLVAVPLGALVATIWAVPLAQRLGLLNLKQISIVATLALSAAGLFFPPAVIFFAFGVPAGLMGGQLAGPNDWLLGFGPGFLVGGAVGVVLHKPVAAILSAAIGAWAIVLGAMAALLPVIPAAIEWLGQNPVAVLTVAAIGALAGAVFQLFVRPSEEEQKKRKIERTLEKKKQKEQKALEERWSKYNQKSE